MKKIMILLVMFMLAGYAEGKAQMYLSAIRQAFFKGSAGYGFKFVAISNIEREISIGMMKAYSENQMRNMLPVLIGKSISDHVSNSNGINTLKTIDIPVTKYNTVAAENEAAEKTAEQQTKSNSSNRQQKQDYSYSSCSSQATMASTVSVSANDETQSESWNSYQMPRWLIFLLLAGALFILYRTFLALKRYEEKINPITETSTENSGYIVPQPISTDDKDAEFSEDYQVIQPSYRGIMLANNGGILVR